MYETSKKAARSVAILFALGAGSAFAAPKAVIVQNPYVKAVPPTMSNTAAYMNLKNTTDKPIQLIKGSSPVCKVIELHQHMHEKGGMMKMIKLDAITIPAHGHVELKPMGMHMMLIGLKPDFHKRKSVRLTLYFSNHTHLTVTAPVRKPQ